MPTPSDDELAQARRGRAEVAAKLEQGGDAEDCAYWRKVIAMWDQHIQRLEEKPPFALNISLEGTRTEHLSKVLARLDELCGEHDRAGESKTKVVIESWDEEELNIIRRQIELYMRQNKILLKSECYIKAPTVRPEPEKTPIEEALERLRPEPGSGIDEVILSGGGRETRLKPRTA